MIHLRVGGGGGGGAGGYEGWHEWLLQGFPSTAIKAAMRKVSNVNPLHIANIFNQINFHSTTLLVQLLCIVFIDEPKCVQDALREAFTLVCLQNKVSEKWTMRF